MDKLRFYLALWFAKGTYLFMRLVGRNASYLPGSIALKICPRFLKYIGRPKRVIAVTGTNGKTTTCNLLIDALRANGVDALNNQLGSNVAAGIATSLLAGATLTGKPTRGTAVFEVDERSSRLILPYIRPDVLCITNLSSDSTARNAHPEFIAGIIESAVPEGTELVLNADDLISNRVAPGNKRVYFGIGPLDTDVSECRNLVNDLKACPVCSGELVYEYRRYHHIGRAHCADCGLRSPDCDYLADSVDTHNMTMRAVDAGGAAEYKLLSDSVFNVYNMIAVIAIMRELGFSHDDIRAGLGSSQIAASRYNEANECGVTVVMHMAKDMNAYACSRVFDYVSERPGKKELVLMIDPMPGGKRELENVSWMYSCDFEFLNVPDITRIVCTGPRAMDKRLRLLFAGIPEEKIRCVSDVMDAPGLLEFADGESVFLLYGTDELKEAFAARDALVRRIGEVYSAR